MGKSFGHEAAHGEINPRLGGGWQALPILGQASVAHEPGERALDDPTLRQNRKPGRHLGRRLIRWHSHPTPRPLHDQQRLPEFSGKSDGQPLIAHISKQVATSG